jgi:magnesium transporter
MTESEEGLWYVGVILVLIGAIGQNLGNNIVSIAHMHEHENLVHDEKSDLLINDKSGDVELTVVAKSDTVMTDSENTDIGAVTLDSTETEKTWFQTHLWGIGTTVFVTSSIMCFVAFGFAAQSLLASLESVQFVSNIIFAKFVLKEDISWTMLASTIAIIGGNSLVVVFSGHGSLLLNGEEIFDLYASNTAFHVYLGIGFCLMAGCEYTWKYYNHSRCKLKTKLWNHSFVEPMCFCIASAIIGAFAVVNAKNISMMLNVSAATDRSEFKHPQIWIISFIWTFIVLFWVGRIDKGLDLFPPLFVIPVIQVCFIVFSIICGGIFFSEFATFSGGQFVGFTGGVLMILVGVYGLAPDSELDFSGDDDDDEYPGSIAIKNENFEQPKRSGRRLSFSATVAQEAVSDITPSQKARPSLKRHESRGRRQSMSHPFAAFKELTRVGGEKVDLLVEENPSLAPVIRTARRLSQFTMMNDKEEGYKERRKSQENSTLTTGARITEHDIEADE